MEEACKPHEEHFCRANTLPFYHWMIDIQLRALSNVLVFSQEKRWRETMQYSGPERKGEEQNRRFPTMDRNTPPTFTDTRIASGVSGYGATPFPRPSDMPLSESLFNREFDEQRPALTLHILLRQTGLGIKVRFLVALILIAIIPAIVLVLLLGDPTGQEQRATLGQALQLQAQGQVTALNQAFASRQQTVATLARKPLLSQIVSGTADPMPGQTVLQTAQQSDPASIGWFLVNSDGTVLATGDSSSRPAGFQLAQTKAISHPGQLAAFVQALSRGTSSNALLLSDDPHISGGWLALASRVSPSPSLSQGGALLALFSLQKATQGLVDTSKYVNGQVSVLLDVHNRIIAHAGQLAAGQIAFAPAPQSLQTLPLGQTIPMIVQDNPLTGQTNAAVGIDVPAINGRYLLLVPQDTSLVPSSRTFFAGRNTPLLLLAIVVAVVLVATWVALPIVRPIRRATREIGKTTEEVRKLAEDARRIAKDHSLGTAILSGANRKLLSRRQTIIRDENLIAQTCDALLPRLQFLHPLVRSAGNRQAIEAMQVVQQGLAQIKELATSTAISWQRDTSLSQLDSAMESAREISEQFLGAGQQLEQDAEQLEVAARTLL